MLCLETTIYRFKEVFSGKGYTDDMENMVINFKNIRGSQSSTVESVVHPD
jgi:hypothetical protein